MRESLATLASRLGGRFEFLEQTSSTNNIAAEGGYGHGDLVVADFQSSGRGQRGNIWSSHRADNLTFSMVIAADIPIHRQFYISKAVSVGIASALSEICDKQVKIKWPNDIYIGDKKICGILIENDIRSSAISKSVVGIGLNVNQRQFDRALPNPTSISIETGEDQSRIDVLERLYNQIMRHIEMLIDGDLETLDRRYMDSLYLLNTWHRYNDPLRGEVYGRIVDVEKDGALIIECKNFERFKYYFKEIEY